MAEQKKDIVERLRGCTDRKYPGFQNLNTEAADTITRLTEENKRMVSVFLDIHTRALGAESDEYSMDKALDQIRAIAYREVWPKNALPIPSAEVQG